MAQVLIFRGGPASGKGTITRELCKLLDKPVALIEQDSLRWGYHLVGRKVSEISETEHIFANNNTKLLFEEYLKNGNYNIVVEGLFTWDDLSSSQGSALELKQIAEKYGYRPKMVLLLADKAELQRRNQARNYSVPEDELKLLYNNVYSNINSEEIKIDSTNLSIQETLEKIKALT